jgi:hypothetical protein
MKGPAMTYNRALNMIRHSGRLVAANQALRAIVPLCESDTDREFALHAYKIRVDIICERRAVVDGRQNRAAEHVAKAAKMLGTTVEAIN